MNALELAACIDHTALNPETTERDIIKLCGEAAEYGFASVCVMPWYVLTAREALAEQSSDILVCTVVGFPNGSHLGEVKQLEARCALDDGALELDMMMNLSAFKTGKREEVQKDIEAIVDIAHERDAILKVIIETCLLNDDEIRRACEIVDRAGADYVKTSSGYSSGGATVEKVRLIREYCPEDMGVKASGGIGDHETAMAMIEAGADRIGSSRSVKIMNGMSVHS